jgi:hypothetical protein
MRIEAQRHEDHDGRIMAGESREENHGKRVVAEERTKGAKGKVENKRVNR